MPIVHSRPTTGARLRKGLNFSGPLPSRETQFTSEGMTGSCVTSVCSRRQCEGQAKSWYECSG